MSVDGSGIDDVGFDVGIETSGRGMMDWRRGGCCR